MTQTENPVTDVLIIGGSHAGLSAALTLYRALHTAVVFDCNKPRNDYSTPVRLTPTWENQSTDKLRDTARQELLSAGLTTFVDAAVQTVEQRPDGLFKLVDERDHTWVGRKVLLAIGARDVFPDLPGYPELFTQGIYPCMWQFGYELRGSSSAGLLAVDGLASPMHAMMLAKDGHKFVDTMTVYTDGDDALAAQISASIDTPGISVDGRKISRLSRGEGQSVIIDFSDGTKHEEAFLVHRPRTEVDSTLADQLGLAWSNMGHIDASPPFCRTSVPGVYAAGDCATPMKIIPNAMTMGAYAGCGLCRELPKREMEKIA